MKSKANIKLELSDNERTNLRQNKIKKSEILEYASDELAVLLNVSELRAKEIYALADFQQIPSIGIEFAKDLIFLGYYRVEELKGKSGAELTDHYEKRKVTKLTLALKTNLDWQLILPNTKITQKNGGISQMTERNIELKLATQKTDQR